MNIFQGCRFSAYSRTIVQEQFCCNFSICVIKKCHNIIASGKHYQNYRAFAPQCVHEFFRSRGLADHIFYQGSSRLERSRLPRILPVLLQAYLQLIVQQLLIGVKIKIVFIRAFKKFFFCFLQLRISSKRLSSSVKLSFISWSQKLRLFSSGCCSSCQSENAVVSLLFSKRGKIRVLLFLFCPQRI